MEKKHIKEWPADERPREMLLEKGPEALSDAALLAILLRTGRKGQNAIELAREMIERFGGFTGLLSARNEDILRVKGIGKAKVAQIIAAMEIVRRQARQPLQKLNVIENPDVLYVYLKTSLQHLPREEFHILHLNRLKHLIGEETLFRGTVDESAIYAREVVDSAIRRKASALIFVHNHPNGPALASDEDKVLTAALINACKAIQIAVLDHIVIGQDGYLSMRRSYPELFA
ncbi:MAG TPA: DNA repair protein RadC [Syntrophales bacterium]|nr:DNA repair protein RadC [Syntrophales bacterium]